MTIAAFLAVFWQADQPSSWLWVGGDDVLWNTVIVVAQPFLFGALSWGVARRSQRLLENHPQTPQTAQAFHHRSTLVLRCLALMGHIAIVFSTRWPAWWALGRITPAVQIVGDLVVLLPFFLSCVAIWIGSFSFERTMHGHSIDLHEPEAPDQVPWKLGEYLDFNLRHHVLAMAVPMVLVLFVADLTRGYDQAIQAWIGWSMAPDAVLGAAVIAVFLSAPLMLCRIWHTEPLPSGPLRQQLEAICKRIGLRYRDILVWHSDKMMINAAVMGVFAPVRYILLSDALLDSMSDAQVEAVFGHEAGHIKRHHVTHFLVFAFVGWLIVAAITELLAYSANANGANSESVRFAIQCVGLLVTILIWGLGFGWLSRRFEREADLFGAECITPDNPDCTVPCSIHNGDSPTPPMHGSVCATGAAIFTSALDRVALLNGIPHDERSWRHSSIGSRIRFLTSLAADPLRAMRFRRLVHRIRLGLVTTAVVGTAVCVIYLTVVEQPAIVAMQNNGVATTN